MCVCLLVLKMMMFLSSQSPPNSLPWSATQHLPSGRRRRRGRGWCRCHGNGWQHCTGIHALASSNLCSIPTNNIMPYTCMKIMLGMRRTDYYYEVRGLFWWIFHTHHVTNVALWWLNIGLFSQNSYINFVHCTSLILCTCEFLSLLGIMWRYLNEIHSSSHMPGCQCWPHPPSCRVSWVHHQNCSDCWLIKDIYPTRTWGPSALVEIWPPGRIIGEKLTLWVEEGMLILHAVWNLRHAYFSVSLSLSIYLYRYA